MQVAQLAGIPRSVIQDAQQRLEELENPVLTQLDKLNHDSLTHKQALDILYQLIHLRQQK